MQTCRVIVHQVQLRRPDVDLRGEGNKAVAEAQYAYERILLLLFPSSIRGTLTLTAFPIMFQRHDAMNGPVR